MSCPECGTVVRRASHADGGCNGLFVEIDGAMRCAECGTEMPLSASPPCPNCDSPTELESERAIATVRPRVAIQRLETALTDKIRRGHPTALETDQTLSAIAREDAALTIEANYIDASATKDRTLGERADEHSASLAQSQWKTFSATVTGQTVDEIATGIYDGHLSEFPEPDERVTFTHVGVGVQWAPVGDAYVSCIARERQAELPADIAPARLEKAIHRATDERRVDNGYDRLAYDDRLADIALNHSRAMATRGSLAHVAPDGTDVGARYENAGYEFRYAGENLAKQFAPASTDTEALTNDVVDGWMNSPDHRENILNDDFSRVGIGLYQTRDGFVFVTQNFS